MKDIIIKHLDSWAVSFHVVPLFIIMSQSAIANAIGPQQWKDKEKNRPTP